MMHSIGERLVAALIQEVLTHHNRKRPVCEREGCDSSLKDVIMQVCGAGEYSVLPELNLKKFKYDGGATVRFDGKQQIDVGVRGEGATLPFEVKLGLERLAKKEVTKRLKVQCEAVPEGNGGKFHVSGNMFAILERTGVLDAVELECTFGEATASVSRVWGLIARQKRIDNWKKVRDDVAMWPAFDDQRTHVFSFDTLARMVGRDRFNQIVTDLLARSDYFAEWVKNEDDG